ESQASFTNSKGPPLTRGSFAPPVPRRFTLKIQVLTIFIVETAKIVYDIEGLKEAFTCGGQ
ncbi:MAG: hypothetical protein LBL15_08305, partial [Oscillospiraceae bacterium]|nr:hypothetical protein [Oscillospiraceae bacterium]